MSVRDVLLAADENARNEAIRLESIGQLPPRFVEQHYGLTNLELRELRRLKAAARAATDVDTYLALCRGEAVPAKRLNSEVTRHHRRRHA